MRQLKLVIFSTILSLSGTIFYSNLCFANTTNVNQFLSQNWESDYHDEITIKKGTTKVEVDGNTIEFDQLFDTTKKEAKKIVENNISIKDFFSDSEYDVSEEKDGTIKIEDKYQTKRIIIPEKKISGYGEKQSCYDGDETILQFDDEKATKDAFLKISQIYKNAYVDEIYNAQNILCSDKSWGISTMGMDALKTKNFSVKVTVAIIDTGLCPVNSLFKNKTISPKSWNVVDNNNKYETVGDWDKSWHGTHIAGIIAESTPSNVILMPIRIYDSSGNTSDSWIKSGLKYAIDNGADVINMSFGITGNNDFLKSELDRARQKNIPVITAAGNDAGAVLYPATSSHTIAVSSINQSLKTSSFSNTGSSIDFAAPGEGIISASKNTSYIKSSGTSMAAAHVSAAAAYIKLKTPGITYNNLYKTMQSHAVDIESPGKDNKSGYGYLDIRNLLGDEVTELKSSNFDLDKTDYSYTGKAIKPKINTQLPDRFYSFSYQNNVRPGTAAVTIVGKSPYKGTVKKIFTITDNSNMSLPDMSVNYDGSYHYPKLKGTLPSSVSIHYVSYKSPGIHKAKCEVSDELGLYKTFYSTLNIIDNSTKSTTANNTAVTNSTNNTSVINSTGYTTANNATTKASGKGTFSKKKLKITGPSKIKAGKKVTLKTNAKSIYGKKVKIKWKVNNKKYASISNKGILKTKKKGKKKTIKVTMTVKNKKVVKKIKII